MIDLGSLETPSPLLTALLIGLGSSAHCLAMCGGVHAVIGDHSQNSSMLIASDSVHDKGSALSVPNAGISQLASELDARLRPTVFLLVFSVGRLLSYSLAGLAFGALAFSLTTQSALWFSGARILSGVLLFAIGLQMLGWRGRFGAEVLGEKIWRVIKNGIGLQFPLKTLGQSFTFGFAWGWIPCGVVYSVLAWAILQTDPFSSAMTMLFFGLGTLPAMLGSGLLFHNVSKKVNQDKARIIASFTVIVFSIWTIFSAYGAFISHADENDDRDALQHSSVHVCH